VAINNNTPIQPTVTTMATESGTTWFTLLYGPTACYDMSWLCCVVPVTWVVTLHVSEADDVSE